MNREIERLFRQLYGYCVVCGAHAGACDCRRRQPRFVTEVLDVPDDGGRIRTLIGRVGIRTDHETGEMVCWLE